MALNGMLGIVLFERLMFCWLRILLIEMSIKALLPGCYTDGSHSLLPYTAGTRCYTNCRYVCLYQSVIYVLLQGYGDFMKKTEKVTYLCPVKACSRSNKERGFPRFQTLKQVQMFG